jgi:ABC-type glycerol-3-phosphate transport system substrate-binding protein
LGLLLLLLSNPLVGALDISLNDQHHRSYDDDFVYSLAFDAPDGGSVVACTELLPPTLETYEVTIHSSGGPVVLRGENLEDRFPQWRLRRGSVGWDLDTGGQIYRAVTELALAGESVPDPDLEVWLSWEGVELLKREIAAWGERHGVRITTVEVPSIDAKLGAVLRSRGPMPDVVMVPAGGFSSLVEGGGLQPLDGLGTASLVESGIHSFSLAGRRWAVPLYYDAQLLFYRRDLVGELEMSLTLGRLEALAGELKGRVPFPMCWNAYSASWFIPFQFGFGKTGVLEGDGALRVDDEASSAALRYLLDLIDEGLVEPAEREAMISLFAGGQAAIILSGSYTIPRFEAMGIDFGVSPYPINERTGRPVAPLLDFKGLAVTSRTHHPMLARRLVQFLTSPGVQQRFCRAVTKLPASTEAGSALGSGPYFEALRLSEHIGTPIPPEPAFAIYKNTMWKLLRLAISGRMTAEQVLAAGQEVIEERERQMRRGKS